MGGAAPAGVADVFVLRRVGGQRFVHLAGTGRGAGWAGIVEVSLATVPTPEPKPEEVVVRIDASPINPSDLGLLLAGADLGTVKTSGTADNPTVTASLSPAVMRVVAGRLEQSLPVGNEAAGVVVQAGSSPAATGAASPTPR